MMGQTWVRMRKCRYCGAEILDDWTGLMHEFTCGMKKRWEKYGGK